MSVLQPETSVSPLYSSDSSDQTESVQEMLLHCIFHIVELSYISLDECAVLFASWLSRSNGQQAAGKFIMCLPL